VEVTVDDLQATPAGVSLTLRSDDARDIHMLIGFPEGQSIMRAMRHEESERPLSADLFKSFLDHNGWRVQKVLIRDLRDGTYFADMTVEKDKDHETQVYDARPSDAMAIGLRYGAKIYVNPQVFEKERQNESPEDPDREEESKPKQLKL
jgi:bifunctional DNase/RNase